MFDRGKSSMLNDSEITLAIKDVYNEKGKQRLKRLN